MFFREDRESVPFYLQLTLININTCQPISQAAILVYFCATVSDYSHCVDGSNNGNSTFRRGKIRTKRAR